jgi:hypothetical protein
MVNEPMAPAPTIEPLYSDAQVAQMLDPTGVRIKARSIRSEREAGRLVGTRIAGKWLYRGSDVAAFLNAAREVNLCLAQTPAPGSSSSAISAGPALSSTSAGPSRGRNASWQRLSMPPIPVGPGLSCRSTIDDWIAALTEFERWQDVGLDHALYVAREHQVTDIVDGMAADIDPAEDHKGGAG